jgi:hypothetical protein
MTYLIGNTIISWFNILGIIKILIKIIKNQIKIIKNSNIRLLHNSKTLKMF